jgi:hypothetical protein
VLIDTPERAKRLANAICHDIAVYNQSAVNEAAPADRTRVLAGPVSEGYALYAARVTSAQLHWFEEAVVALHEGLGVPFHGIAMPPPR